MDLRRGLQRLSGALMVPIVVLPAAAIYLAIGSQTGLAPIRAAGAAILIEHLPLLFAVGVAIGFTRQDGMAALAAVVGYQVLNAVVLSIAPVVSLGGGVEVVTSTGVLGGILVGAYTAYLYHRFHTVQFPEWLGLFSGKRFIPIVTSLVSLVTGVVLGFAWPPIQQAITRLGEWVHGAGAPGVFVYGALNRLLIPTGLHHILQNLILYVFGSFADPVSGRVLFGEEPRFYAGDPAAGFLAAGWFLVMVFAIPAICLAITHEAKPQRRRQVAGIMLTGALTAIVTGITEPIEFAFLFASPLLYVLHSLLSGLALLSTWLLGVRHYGFALPMFFINLGLSTRPWLIFPLGAACGVLYYFLFRFLIRALNIPTPGREALDTEADLVPGDGLQARAVLEACGGPANVLAVESCLTRLRLLVIDAALVDAERLKGCGAKAVSRLGGGNLQVILGTSAEQVRDGMRPLLQGPTLVVGAPVDGKVLPLAEVPDAAFQSGALGQGAALLPTGLKAVAPAAGVLGSLFPGGHAFAVKTPAGVEIIVHIGLDTVSLKGEGFRPAAAKGDRVRAGQVIVEFDPARIQARGLSTATPVVVGPAAKVARVAVTGEPSVKAGDPFLYVWVS